jgi:HlyD family secretion protein
MDVIAQVLVKVNDKVFAGEPLIRLTDNEARARLAAAEAQVAFRLRARNDETAPPRRTARRRAKDAVADADKAAARRRAEDAVANADNAVVEAQAALDKAAVDNRAGRATDVDCEAARTALSQAQDRLKQQKAELRRIETGASTPLPNVADGQVNVAAR